MAMWAAERFSIQLTFFSSMKIVGFRVLGGLWALEWACATYKATESKSEIPILYLWWFIGVKVGVANFLLGQSIGIDENNTFQLKFFF